MHKSKVKPILALVCKGDAFTNLRGPHTCLIDLLLTVCLYCRIGAARPPIDIKEKRSKEPKVIGQCFPFINSLYFSRTYNLIERGYFAYGQLFFINEGRCF
ncbi:MAG: hypothetical protein A3G39_10625 [Deltaproteobacteria bacterium RIFCSPLOWO2_12_FULL_43_16]|nr:MAG: hypothetical protein A2Z89_00735 [Deltaproteobacteria bacterium GWA2_43_19]OGQ10454.1 MAG: hypothetical protein A3D30_06580 [Deltaproteobacteria bacterium RIFCSPHIGHO2_02_FULL_43_33]OGQ35534.1 MAG: hypothetical protein A3A85_08675 [Deltaproteobacteria bacterium RIFCSPLOWO2_01_FULL_42_9]OGQ59350.1 MAG: hypothetical protein A3G39_10625 [Deltaproteobacteria bacterium RIFCSPLOWO2_12_FULL_43_16]HBR17788.1 hypothetical protein [Deltaproteobacteria bacterium]